jgi:hypothetical protein
MLVASMALTGGLAATVDGSDPLGPVLTLTNTGDEPCQIAETTLGTIAVTAVEQDATPAVPVPIDVAVEDGLQLNTRLTTLEPGSSARLPLRVVPIGHDEYALEAVSWSETAGAYGALYPIRTGDPVAIVLTYSVPFPVTDGPPACEPANATVELASGTSGTARWILVGGIAAGVLIVGLILVAVLLTRRRRAGAAAVVVLFSIAVVLWHPDEARADYTVDSDLQSAFDACMAIFREPGNDPAGILPALDDPDVNIQIIETNGDITHTNVLGRDHSIIYWDPEDRHRYHGSGGNADPCTSLYHEMHHAYQGTQGTWSRDLCATSDPRGRTLEKTEVLATHAQNLLRRRLGMPVRDHYGDIPLPADCQPPEDPERCTGDNCGESNGDPHLRTFDGKRYDFQAAGEFVAARSAAGEFEVQVRQEPPRGHTSRSVTLNTAVAMDVDGTTIELRSGAPTMTLLVDGVEREFRSEGPLKITGRTALISWADGSRAYVRPIGQWGLHVAVQPSGVHAGKLEGLLGDFDADKANDIRPRGGDPITPSFEALYPAFADSWRVDAGTSLFAYAPGTGPETYVDRNYPQRQVTIDQLPNRGAAEALCRGRGITDPEVLTGCVLDVALTGLAEFAEAAGGSQAIEPVRDFGGTRYDVKITEPGGTATVEFPGTAGQQVFVDIPITTLPNQCGGIEIRGPAGRRVGSSGCIINGKGHIDSTTLPESGTYTIVVDATGDRTGEARLMLITIADQNATIEPDGPAVISKIDKPGVISRFTFDGVAGQKVFVDIQDSTLPNQCGGLALEGPGGRRVGGSGCVIHGLGHIDAVVLPDTGTYTISIDPNGRNVGESRVRLNTASDQTGTVTVDGSSVRVDIAQPGAEAHFTFTGVAGQRVAVEIVDATLPNQCGGYHLQAPSGTRIVNFCVIAGEGTFSEEGIVLAESGTYTIGIDPADRRTGTATLRVRSA